MLKSSAMSNNLLPVIKQYNLVAV